MNFSEFISEKLSDPDIEEIMYNGPNTPVKIFKKGSGHQETDFTTDDVSSFISEVSRFNNAVIDKNRPMLDGTLQDGSRVNITIPPVSNYISITIRKFNTSEMSILDLNMLSDEAAAFLWTAVDGLGSRPANIIVVGGTATGKTTFLNALTTLIPKTDRIVTIEDTIELRLMQDNIIRMISTEEFSMDDLLKNTLRMRPDRILVGEVRGSEAKTLFDAMNTGHNGCMGTLHANSARDTIARVTAPPMDVDKNMLSGLDLIVVLKKTDHRFISEITEIANLKFNTLYSYDAKRKELVWTGIPSRLRTEISESTGLSPKDFDTVLKLRKKHISKKELNDSWKEELEEYNDLNWFQRLFKS